MPQASLGVDVSFSHCFTCKERDDLRALFGIVYQVKFFHAVNVAFLTDVLSSFVRLQKEQKVLKTDPSLRLKRIDG